MLQTTSQKDIGFNSDYNEVTIIDNDGNYKFFKKNKKSIIEKKVVEIILDKLVSEKNLN